MPAVRFFLVYLLLLACGIIFVEVGFSVDKKHNRALFEHDANQCTLYCESDGCTHPAIYQEYRSCMGYQVARLKQLPVPYEIANLLVYVLAYPLLIYCLLFFLLSDYIRVYIGARFGLFCLLLLAGMVGCTFMFVGFPDVSSLFWSCCNFCLQVSRYLGLSLYDTYTIIFVFILYGLPLFLFVLVVFKCLYARQRKRRAKGLSPNVVA